MNSRNAKEFLFISGIQRSGTTALTNTLNCHREVTVCIERFKKLINHRKCEQLTPALFEKEALLDFSTDYTNCTPQHSDRFANFYNDLESHYERLKYIGDKIANDPGQIPNIYKRFPNTKIVYIVRDIFEIACSWQSRAERESDKWPADKTAIHAVEPWNDINAQILSMWESYPDDIFVIDYHKFFGAELEDSSQLDNLTCFLNISDDENLVAGYNKSRGQYAQKIRDKPRKLPQNTVDYIASYSDDAQYQRVCAINT